MLLLLKTLAQILDMHSKLLTWIVSGFLVVKEHLLI
jgi:hypothetical protein